MKRKFRTADKSEYTIEDSEVGNFLNDFPDAQEIKDYTIESNGKQESYSISESELPAFMNDFPEAFSEKKKEVTEPTDPPVQTQQQSQPTSATPAPTSQEPKKEEPQQPGKPVETGQPDSSAQLKGQVESSKKKSRVSKLTEDVYNTQEALSKLIVEATNPNLSGQRYAEIQSQINGLYNSAKENLESLKKEAPNKANYDAIASSIDSTFNVFRQYRNSKQSAALGEDYIDPVLGMAVKGFTPETAKTQTDAQTKVLKDSLYKIEEGSKEKTGLTREKQNISLASHVERIKQAKDKINEIGLMGDNNWSPQQMAEYLSAAQSMALNDIDALEKKLPKNQKWMTDGMRQAVNSMVSSYVSLSSTGSADYRKKSASGHNEWLSNNIGKLESDYAITRDQQLSAGGVKNELDAYIMYRGSEFNYLDPRDVREIQKRKEQEYEFTDFNKKEKVDKSKQATIGVQAAEDRVMKAAINDYFAYASKVNPAFAQMEKEKYEYARSNADRSGSDEKFMIDIEKKALGLAVEALSADARSQQFDIKSFTKFEDGLKLDTYKVKMAEMKKDSDAFKVEYEAALKKGQSVKSEWENFSAPAEETMKKLNESLKNGTISQEKYDEMFIPVMEEYNRRLEETNRSFPNMDDLNARRQAIDDRIAQIELETGVNQDAIDKLESAGQLYEQYGFTTDKLDALNDVYGRVGSFYFEAKNMDRENKRMAEYRALGEDSELGRQLESMPWYMKGLKTVFDWSGPGLISRFASTEFGRATTKSVGEGVLSVAKVPEIMFRLGGGDGYGWTGKLYDYIGDMEAEREGSFGSLEKFGYQVSATTKAFQFGGSVFGSILLYAGPGGLVRNASNLTKSAVTWGTSYLTTQADYYDECLQIAKEQGKSPQWAAGVTQGLSVVMSSVETMIPDIKYFEPSAARKTILGALREGKTAKEGLMLALDALPDSMKSYLFAALPESFEEFAGTAGENAFKALMNAVGQVEYFRNLDNIDPYVESIAGGAVGGTAGNIFSRPDAGTQDMNQLMYEAVSNYDNTIASAKNEKEKSIRIERMKDAKVNFDNLSTHTNWKGLDQESKVQAFALLQQTKAIQSQIEEDNKSGVIDDEKAAKVTELQQEMNDILASPQVAGGAVVRHYNNTKDLINAMEAEDGDMEAIVSNPLWRKITDASRDQIEDISYDIRMRKSEMKEMDKNSPEYAAASEEVKAGKQKIKDLLNNTEAYDSKNIPGIPGQVREGQKPIGGEPVVGGGQKPSTPGGILQDPKEIADRVADITRMLAGDDKSIAENGEGNLTPEARQQMERELNQLQGVQYEQSKEDGQQRMAVEEEAVVEPVVVETEQGTEEVALEPETEEEVDVQAKIQELEGLIAQDDKAQAETGTGILSSREEVENQLADLKEQEKYEPKEETRAEEESAQAEAEYTQNKESLMRVDPTMDERQADLATAFFQDGMTAKESIDKAKKQLSLDDRKKKAEEAKKRVKERRQDRVGREMKASAESLEKFLKAAGIKVRSVETSEEFEKQTRKGGGTKKTQGIFFSKSGEIILNNEKLRENWDKWGKNIVLHEGTHPVINIIRNTDPKRYKKLVDGLKKERLRNRGIQKAWEFASKYESKGEQTVEDEFVVESLSQISAGKVLLSEMPKSRRDWFIDKLNGLAKYFDLPLMTKSSSDAEVRDFAKRLKEAMTQGGGIEDVVGKKKTKEFKGISKGQKYEAGKAKAIKPKGFEYDNEYDVVVGNEKIGRMYYDRSLKAWKNAEFDTFSVKPYTSKSVYGDILGETKQEAIDELERRNKESKSAKKEAPKTKATASDEDVKGIYDDIQKSGMSVERNPLERNGYIIGGNVSVKIYPFEGNIHIGDIQSMEKGKGNATAVMNQIIAAADARGLKLDLDAKAYGDSSLGQAGLSTSELLDFYAKFGFEVDPEGIFAGDSIDKIKDYVGKYPNESVSMVREPMQAEEQGQAYEADDTDLELIEGFYSPIEKRINEFKQPRASVQKWRDMVGKKEEAKFTGVYEWLNSMKPEQIISKQEVIDWMRANRFQIKSVARGGTEVTLDKDEWLRTKENGKFVWNNNGFKIVEESRNRFIPYTPSGLVMSEKPWANLEILIDRLQKPNVAETQYSRYQLDTGKPPQDYQETVILAPNPDLDKVKAYNALVEEYQKFMESGQKVTAAVFKKQEKYEQDISTAKKNLPKGTMFSGDRAILPRSKKEHFQSQHFSEQNVIASLRTNIRTDVNTGEKVFFIEESQSDWGQSGGQRGFFNPELTQELQKLETEYSDLINKTRQFEEGLREKYTGSKYSREYFVPVGEDMENLRKLVDAREEAAEKMDDFVQAHPEFEEGATTYTAANGKEYLIPTIEGPYVGDTNAWTKMNLKYAIKQAVEAGADKIAWTNGQQQFERYNSEKVAWEKTPTGWNVEVSLTAEGKPEKFTVSSREDFDKIIDEKMRREETNQPRGQRELDKMSEKIWKKMQTVEKGDSLPRKEGMEAYYGTDTTPGILGNVMNALNKELTGGPSQLGMTDIGVGNVQQSIEITPELIDSVNEGMPQFHMGYEDSDLENETRMAIGEAGITTADVNKWMQDNKVNNLNDPKTRKKFENDFKVKLPTMSKARAEGIAELPKSVDGLIEDVITAIGEDYDSGMDMDTAIQSNFTSQPWYNALTQDQKNEIAEIIDSTFEEEIKQEEKVRATEEAAGTLPESVKKNTKKLVDLNNQLRETKKSKDRVPIREQMDKLLEGDDKLTYIWKHLKSITNQLADADPNKLVLTKSGDCP